MGTLEKNGMTVERANDTLMGQLKEMGEVMTNEWLEEAGEDGKAIVDAYKGE